MFKIALVFLGVFFGLLYIVTSEQLYMEEKESPVLEDVDDKSQNENERSGHKVTGSGYVKQKALSAGSPQFNLVECYTCSDCPKVLPNTSSKICPFTLDLTKQGCVVYVEQYTHMNKPWYIRGCASERGSCADIRKAHPNNSIVKLLSCTMCDEDKCNTNSASHSISDLTMAFFVMVVTPIIVKYTLS